MSSDTSKSDPRSFEDESSEETLDRFVSKIEAGKDLQPGSKPMNLYGKLDLKDESRGWFGRMKDSTRAVFRERSCEANILTLKYCVDKYKADPESLTLFDHVTLNNGLEYKMTTDEILDADKKKSFFTKLSFFSCVVGLYGSFLVNSVGSSYWKRYHEVNRGLRSSALLVTFVGLTVFQLQPMVTDINNDRKKIAKKYEEHILNYGV
jgi:hypothetical protein